MTLYDDAQTAAAKVVDDAFAAAQSATASTQAALDKANATITEDATERAALQAKVDTITAQDASDQAKLAALQAAFDAYKAAHPDVPVSPVVVPDVHEYVDFGQQGALMIYLPTGSLVGKGVDVSTSRMKPGSSTKAAKVPTASGTNNPLFLIHAGGLSATAAAKVELGGFTLEGTDQGHLYHGVRIGYGSGSSVHDLRISGIPGSSSSPPGETASLSFWHADSPVMANVVLDGRRVSDGAQVAASLFEMNYTTGALVWTGGSATFAKYGFGQAMFQCKGDRTFIGLDLRNNRKAINLEQELGGTITYRQCDFRGTTGADYIAQISTLGLTVSAKLIFEDCTFDNDQCRVNTYTTAANGGQNGQKDADVQRWDTVAGKLVQQTADAKLHLTHE